jgi:hypothetical protein
LNQNDKHENKTMKDHGVPQQQKETNTSWQLHHWQQQSLKVKLLPAAIKATTKDVLWANWPNRRRCKEQEIQWQDNKLGPKYHHKTNINLRKLISWNIMM